MPKSLKVTVERPFVEDGKIVKNIITNVLEVKITPSKTLIITIGKGITIEYTKKWYRGVKIIPI
jgi:hypothetical protein